MESKHKNLPSEQKFGVFLCTLLFFLSLYLLYASLSALSGITLSAMLITLAVTRLSPTRLRPLNKAWFSLGLTLGRIVNPVILGIIFFAVITPVALLMRVFGRDELNLRAIKGKTNWRNRSDRFDHGEHFDNQF